MCYFPNSGFSKDLYHTQQDRYSEPAMDVWMRRQHNLVALCIAIYVKCQFKTLIRNIMNLLCWSTVPTFGQEPCEDFIHSDSNKSSTCLKLSPPIHLCTQAYSKRIFFFLVKEVIFSQGFEITHSWTTAIQLGVTKHKRARASFNNPECLVWQGRAFQNMTTW